MPVLFTNTHTGIPCGSCDHCGAGSDSIRHLACGLVALDGDGEAPWVCFECYEANRGEDGESDDYDGESAAREHIEVADFASDYVAPIPRLMLPVLPGRAARLISLEQEVGAGAGHIASRLYSAGFTVHDQLVGYGHGETGGFCRVEEDSSVNGEIVYGKLRLEMADTARRLEDALSLVKGAISDGTARLDMRCGFHIHVGIQGYSMHDVESLYHLWNHMEDTIFRLASANWNDHRTVVTDHNYSPTMPKGLMYRGEIGNRLSEDRRALNFSNFFYSRSSCRCGAFSFENWAACTCELPKPTVEFRVFNATANLRKIHAYSALSLAMVEIAQRRKFHSDNHESFAWGSSGGSVSRIEETKTALALIFEELPLTDSEREDIGYCCERSSLRDVYQDVYGAVALTV